MAKMGTKLVVTSGLMATLLAEAATAGSLECCGLLLGEAGGPAFRIVRAVPVANVATEPTHRFEIDPVVLLQAHKTARTGGAPLIGYYHSHPNGRAEPSPDDQDMATGDGRIWAIIACGAGTGSVSFWRDAPLGFERLPYDVEEG